MTLKKGFGKCSLFVSSANGWKDQNMASSFSRQRNPNMEKALFDWPIVLQYDVKEISRKFFGHEVCLPARSLSQPKPRCVCIRFIHQSNRSISVCLLFLFCSRVFISRAYENRSTIHTRWNTQKHRHHDLNKWWVLDSPHLPVAICYDFVVWVWGLVRVGRV